MKSAFFLILILTTFSSYSFVYASSCNPFPECNIQTNVYNVVLYTFLFISAINLCIQCLKKIWYRKSCLISTVLILSLFVLFLYLSESVHAQINEYYEAQRMKELFGEWCVVQACLVWDYISSLITEIRYSIWIWCQIFLYVGASFIVKHKKVNSILYLLCLITFILSTVYISVKIINHGFSSDFWQILFFIQIFLFILFIIAWNKWKSLKFQEVIKN